MAFGRRESSRGSTIPGAYELLLLSIFLLIPFQRRFHGFFDALSRTLTRPDCFLPEFFSRKIHLFVSDLLIIALVLLLFFRFKVSLRAFFWEGPSKYLTLLFFVFLLSTGNSVSKTYALQYLRLLQFSFIFLFFNAICCVRERIDLSRFIPRVAWLLVFVSLFESVVAIYQYFTQQPLGLGYLGETSPKNFPFAHSGEHLWLLGKIVGSKLNTGSLFRVPGTFLSPNILGGFLFCSVMASYYLCVQAAEKMKRVFLLSVILLQFFTLYLSFSRSAILALILSTSVWCFLQLKKGGSLRRIAPLAGTVLFSALACLILLYPQLKARGGLINYNSIAQGADTERIVYMKAAGEMIKEHPLLGVGYNNFQIHIHKLQPHYPYHYLHSKVHNIYLLIASEAGLIGLGVFLLFLLALLRAAWKGLFSDSHIGSPVDLFQIKAFLLSTFIGFLLIGGCDFYFLENPQGTIPFFGIAALLYGVNAAAVPKPVASPGDYPQTKASSIFGIILACFSGGYTPRQKKRKAAQKNPKIDRSLVCG